MKSPHLSAIAIISDRLAASTCPAITAIPASPAASAFLTVFGPIAGKSTRRSWPGFGRLTSTPRRPRSHPQCAAPLRPASACGRCLPRPRWLRSGRPSRWPPARYRSARARRSTQTRFAISAASSSDAAVLRQGAFRRQAARGATSPTPTTVRPCPPTLPKVRAKQRRRRRLQEAEKRQAAIEECEVGPGVAK